MQKYFILLASLLIVGAVMFGCDDRGTGITRVDMGELESWGVDPSPSHVFQPALTLQLRNVDAGGHPREQLLGAAYVPPEAVAGKPLPLLILLAPATGTQYYYFQAGLGELIRELTASGQIKPMVVFCMANDQTFGGFFYGNSDPAGRYDSIFNSDDTVWVNGHSQVNTGTRDDLLQYLHTFYPATIRQASKRGIGGIGQGAYGAFRAAIKNPGLFSSISVADGPMDFDGPNGTTGLISLFDDALAEQKDLYYTAHPIVDTLQDSIFDAGANYDDIWIDTTFPGGVETIDTIWVDYDTLPFDYYRDIDTSYTVPASMMLMGAAFAFSPNDTLITYTRTTVANTVIIISNVTQYQIHSPGTGDSTTFIGTLVKSDSYSHNLDMDFHLPFDSSGELYQPIWDMWMHNNLETIYGDQGGNPLAGVKMFFATNPNTHWNHYEMTQSWLSFLRSEGYSNQITEHPYSSYNGDPVVQDEYLFDLLREMLIFHSNNFENAD